MSDSRAPQPPQWGPAPQPPQQPFPPSLTPAPPARIRSGPGGKGAAPAALVALVGLLVASLGLTAFLSAPYPTPPHADAPGDPIPHERALQWSLLGVGVHLPSAGSHLNPEGWLLGGECHEWCTDGWELENLALRVFPDLTTTQGITLGAASRDPQVGVGAVLQVGVPVSEYERYLEPLVSSTFGFNPVILPEWPRLDLLDPDDREIALWLAELHLTVLLELSERLPQAGSLEPPYRHATGIPSGTRLLGVEIDGSTVVVNLSSEVRSGGGYQQLLMVIGQIGHTALVVEGLEEVRILVEGRPLEGGFSGLFTDGSAQVCGECNPDGQWSPASVSFTAPITMVPYAELQEFHGLSFSVHVDTSVKAAGYAAFDLEGNVLMHGLRDQSEWYDHGRPRQLVKTTWGPYYTDERVSFHLAYGPGGGQATVVGYITDWSRDGSLCGYDQRISDRFYDWHGDGGEWDEKTQTYIASPTRNFTTEGCLERYLGPCGFDWHVRYGHAFDPGENLAELRASDCGSYNDIHKLRDHMSRVVDAGWPLRGLAAMRLDAAAFTERRVQRISGHYDLESLGSATDLAAARQMVVAMLVANYVAHDILSYCAPGERTVDTPKPVSVDSLSMTAVVETAQADGSEIYPAARQRFTVDILSYSLTVDAARNDPEVADLAGCHALGLLNYGR